MAWKIKHKDTGLFLGKSKRKVLRDLYKSYKTNLRKFGKIYEQKPTETQLNNWFDPYYNQVGEAVKFDLNNFEYIEV